MLLQIGTGPEPNLSIGEFAVLRAKLAHGYAREPVLDVDVEKLPQRLVASERLTGSAHASRGGALFRGRVHSPRQSAAR